MNTSANAPKIIALTRSKMTPLIKVWIEESLAIAIKMSLPA
jgi:hypothetical protein